MSERGGRWLLWIACLATVPVPILVVGPGHVPTLRLFMLASIGASVLLFEQWGGAVPLLVSFLLLQAAGYGAWFWLMASLAIRYGRRGGSPAITVVPLLLALFAVAVATSIYDDPYQAESPRVGFFGVYR